jgi:3-hydroxybutyrate dehydrogenase
MDKKIAIITGGSSGIGQEIASHLHSMGFTAISFDLKAPANSNIKFIECDVSSEAKVKGAFEEVSKNFGLASVLINNSGLQFMSSVEEFPIEKWNQLIAVMLTGTFLVSRSAIPMMKKNKWGRIINISSVHGKEASPFKAAYVSAKHGVLGLSKVMAQELAEDSITVNSICPGYVDTPLMRNQVESQMKLHNLTEAEVLNQVFLKNSFVKKLTTPKQVAKLVEFLISDAADTITGEAYNISGGWGMGR